MVGSVFRRAEQRLGIGVVVLHPWPGKGSEDAQFLQPAFQRCGTHGVAVIGMENQWLAPALADPLSQAASAHQIRCDGWILTLRHIPGHYLSTPDVDYQVEVQPDPADRCGEIGDISALHTSFGLDARSLGTGRGACGGLARPRRWT
tara:strand:+ start:14023 stop:14463 length:441 start_codon:yes stop_codon:yes gene_type:complete